MSRPYFKDIECSECFETSEVEVTPFTPADRRGRFEDAEPSSGGTLDPSECPECGCEFQYEEEEA